jgi:hypothetical protein
MTKLLIYGFLIYLLYKIIFDVVVPVRKGVKTVRQNMEEMQRNAGFTSQNSSKSAPKSTIKPVEKDAEYIDFEEVK